MFLAQWFNQTDRLAGYDNSETGRMNAIKDGRKGEWKTTCHAFQVSLTNKTFNY